MGFEVGQTVFVVQQHRRNARENEIRLGTEEATILKVGRKYAYLGTGFNKRAFSLETGVSHHPDDCNARANGFGFDVFASREVWLEKSLAESEYVRLKGRLRTPGGIIEMTPVAVRAIHEILDTLD